MKIIHKPSFFLSVLITLFVFGCASQSEVTVAATPEDVQPETSGVIDVEFTLQTVAGDGKLLYVGRGGEIDGIINPDLVVSQGAVVRIILINGDGMPHDLFIPDLDAKMEYVKKIGEQTEIVFEIGAMQPGSYVYYCTLPGHRKAGQEGKLIVEEK